MVDLVLILTGDWASCLVGLDLVRTPQDGDDGAMLKGCSKSAPSCSADLEHEEVLIQSTHLNWVLHAPVSQIRFRDIGVYVICMIMVLHRFERLVE